jgi:hypothetical protein
VKNRTNLKSPVVVACRRESSAGHSGAPSHACPVPSMVGSPYVPLVSIQDAASPACRPGGCLRQRTRLAHAAHPALPVRRRQARPRGGCAACCATRVGVIRRQDPGSGRPTSTVLYPSDANQTAQLVAQMADRSGIVYLRTTREKTSVLCPPETRFTIGGSAIFGVRTMTRLRWSPPGSPYMRH